MSFVYDDVLIDLAPPGGFSLGADGASADYMVGPFLGGAIQFCWEGANTPLSKGRIVPQASVNREDWCNLVLSSSAKQVDDVEGCQIYEFTSFGYKWLRCAFIANGSTQGTARILLYVKRHRIA